MSLNEHKAAIVRYYKEAWDKDNVDVIDEIFHSNYITYDLPQWRKPGAEGLKEFIKDQHRMFPDVRSSIDDLIAEGDKVVVRVSFNATHKGDLVGPVGLVKATNKKISFRGILIYRFKDDKVSEVWSITDNMELMQKLGAVPRPER